MLFAYGFGIAGGIFILAYLLPAAILAAAVLPWKPGHPWGGDAPEVLQVLHGLPRKMQIPIRVALAASAAAYGCFVSPIFHNMLFP